MQQAKLKRIKQAQSDILLGKADQIKSKNNKVSQNEQVNKINGGLKFSRQQQSKMSNPTSHRTTFIIPELNLIKTPTKQNLQASPHHVQQSTYISKKTLNRAQTKQTKFPLNSQRQSSELNENIKIHLMQSPTASNRYMQNVKSQLSPFNTLFKSKKSSESQDGFNSEADKEQLLLLEIKQLKRENTFLKKKIRDLNKELNGGYLPEQCERTETPGKKVQGMSKKQKGFPRNNIQTLHLSLNLFFEEIRNLLTSVTQLFKIQFTQQEIIQFQSLHTPEQMVQELTEEICPLKKHEILKKFFLKRKLQRMAFQEETKRYELVLDIFTEYYTFKEQSQRKVVDTIDSMVMYTNDLNKWLIEKAYSKKMKSEVQSQKSTTRQFISAIQPPKFQTLRVPANMINHVSKVRGPNLSPMPKSKQNK